MPNSPSELTEAEWSIIRAIWSAEPCTAPSIQLALQKRTKWTYSTVRTLMDRMVKKGLLSAEKEGHITIYRSIVKPGQAQRSELLYTLKNAFNNAVSPMLQCLLAARDLSEADLNELESMIKSRRNQNKQ
jgi:BlaI family penicillinase repressor